MLHTLRIQNLAVVEDVTLSFREGLNVLTGSTGAGKSLILGAVNILLGERVRAGTVRRGCDKATIEAEFVVATAPPSVLLESHDGHRLTVRRDVQVTGRSYAFVNGSACTLKQLQEITRALIEPHGQNEQLQLRHAENHVAYVDKVAGNDALRVAYEDSLDAFRLAERELVEFDKRIELLKEKKELLEHRISELERTNLRAHEKSELEGTIRVLSNAQTIFQVLGEAVAAVYDDESSAANAIAQAKKGIDRIAELDVKFERFAAAFDSAQITLADTVSDIRSYLDTLEFDPAALNEMQERLAYLTGLERRYKMPIEDLLVAVEQWRGELNALSFEDEERARLQNTYEKRLSALAKCARALTKSRKEAAARLDREMTQELGQLMMPGASFRTKFDHEADAASALEVEGRGVRIKPDGVDEVLFQVRTNPGEAEGSVSDIASSGELSRIALALKKISSAGREGSVLVFDELDAGIGADLGDMIAAKLSALAKHYQMICITHMPQIAAKGSHHLVVGKSTEKGRTFTHVAPVDGRARLTEIARMLGGTDGSEKRLALAAEMLQTRNTSTSVRP